MTKRHHDDQNATVRAPATEPPAGHGPSLPRRVPTERAPALGDTVIYSHPGGPKDADNPVQCAAIVIDDGSEEVSLFVMYPKGGAGLVPHVKRGTEFGTWHWPVRSP